MSDSNFPRIGPPSAGGSATAYGILYQLLGTAHWAAGIRLNVPAASDEWDEATLVIEPSNGGDIRVDGSTQRIVEQWKAKSDGGTWSLTEVINRVLPDLYRAVDLTSSIDTEFRFVTEGRRGQWHDADRFFRELAVMPDGDPLATLDDREQLRFAGGESLTRLSFFNRILQRLSKHSAIRDDPDAATKLCYLLGNFRMVGGRTIERIVREVDALLLPLVDFREQVEEKRRELCGALLELASSGEVTVTASQLLAKVDLAHISFTHWVRARDAITRALENTLRTWRYHDELDVRGVVNPRPAAPIVVFSGESGQGKTWRLAAFAREALSSGAFAVSLTTSGDAEADLRHAAEVVWRQGFRREGPTDLNLIEGKRQEHFRDLPHPWLTICIDDVQSMKHARMLVQRTLATSVQLVFTAPEAVAKGLKAKFGQDVEIVPVGDFSTAELQRYLRVRGRDWGRLPHDVRHVLRRPLMAALYCESTSGCDWRGNDEYSLLKSYWRRLVEDRDQVDHPSDVEGMRKLALQYLQSPMSPSWTTAACRTAGLDSAATQRLEAVGWLRRFAGGVTVIHQRLLNWAIAEAFVEDRVGQELSTEEFCEAIKGIYHSRTLGLGYVAMDVCWLLLEAGLASDLSQLIETLDTPDTNWHAKGLYTEQLPTLGPRVIAPMVERLEREAVEDSPLVAYIGSAIGRIGKQHPEAAGIVREWGYRMLAGESPVVRMASLAVLAQFPSGHAMDLLWSCHCKHITAEQQEDDRFHWLARRSSFEALRKCARLNVAWLSNRILRSHVGTEPFSELAYLVANVPGEEGKHLWLQVKDHLFAKVPPGKPRCLATCIHQHKDDSEIERLKGWLDLQNDLSTEAAFSAIVHLAPSTAVELIPSLEPRNLYFTRESSLAALMRLHPAATHANLRAVVHRATEKWRAAQVYQDDPHQIDEETLETLLDELADLARKAADSPQEWSLRGPLGLLSKVCRWEHVSLLQMRAGTPLEHCLSTVACGWVGRFRNAADFELKGAIRLLTMIGGVGITQVVNTHLASDDPSAQLRGTSLALIRPDDRTRQLLLEITRHPNVETEPVLCMRATDALAALGENRAVVESVSRSGLVSLELMDLRRRSPPMNDSDINGVLTAMRTSTNERQRAGATRALGVSGREDYAGDICEVLQAAKPDSDLALAATEALFHLGCVPHAAIPALQLQLAIPSHQYAAILSLLCSPGPDATSILLGHLQSGGVVPGSATCDVLIRNLWERPETRKDVGELLWQNRHDTALWPPAWLSYLDSPDVDELQAHLIEVAHEPQVGVHIVGLVVSAILALAKTDPDAAFRAAEIALQTGNDDLHLLPEAIVEIDNSRGLPVLLEFCAGDCPTLAKWAVGRALRRLTDRRAVREGLDQMMRSDSVDGRISGVELAGWQPSNDVLRRHLVDVASGDPDAAVRRSALGSLRRQESFGFAKQLISEFKSARGVRDWIHVRSIVKVADPWLLTTSNDALSLIDALTAKPISVQHQAAQLINRKKEELQREAADEDRITEE